MSKKEVLIAAMDGCGIPQHMRNELADYVLEGRPLGHFLEAVVCNSLSAAIARGDAQNQAHLHNYVVFLTTYVSAHKWGDYARYKGWIDANKSEGGNNEQN